ncbi:MAG: hypothetical protein CUN55_05100 [Phototrophicales bacterium]|nr:MAG: hypothetical protein CUN55_05100 [Phototrophicales bacterium]
MSYYPAGTIIMENTAIVRERSLPPHVYGDVTVSVGIEVAATQVVAKGEMPQDFIVVDVAKMLNLKPKQLEQLADLWQVEVGQRIQAGTPLVKARRRREQKRVPKAPATGTITLIEDGRVFLRANPRIVEVHARIPGQVIEAHDRGVKIRSTGTLIQCAWGNGRFGFSNFAFEPENGLASLEQEQNLFSKISGRVYILERPITEEDLRIVAKLELGGLVAPSMPFYLREVAMMLEVPIILTEGFGERRVTRLSYDLLRKYKDLEGAFDAMLPQRWQPERPEIMLPRTLTSAVEADLESSLVIGMKVRVRTAPYLGEIVEIVRLPDTPIRLTNGLRTKIAEVRVRNREIVPIPLANLEIMGDSRQ